MLKIDEVRGVVSVDGPDGETTHPLESPEAFRLVSKAWVRCGWDTKYVYSFSWMGRPIIQLPEDVLRIQEVIYRVKPDVIIETGVAHGGSLIFYASLFKAMGRGRVIGIDIDQVNFAAEYRERAIEDLCSYFGPSVRSLAEEKVLSRLIGRTRPAAGDAEVLSDQLLLAQDWMVINALAMEPLGHIAGVASSFVGFYATAASAIFGWIIGQAFDGTVRPLTIGFTLLAGLTLVSVLWTEHGRLFTSRDMPAHGERGSAR